MSGSTRDEAVRRVLPVEDWKRHAEYLCRDTALTNAKNQALRVLQLIDALAQAERERDEARVDLAGQAEWIAEWRQQLAEERALCDRLAARSRDWFLNFDKGRVRPARGVYGLESWQSALSIALADYVAARAHRTTPEAPPDRGLWSPCGCPNRTSGDGGGRITAV